MNYPIPGFKFCFQILEILLRFKSLDLKSKDWNRVQPRLSFFPKFKNNCHIENNVGLLIVVSLKEENLLA